MLSRVSRIFAASQLPLAPSANRPPSRSNGHGTGVNDRMRDRWFCVVVFAAAAAAHFHFATVNWKFGFMAGHEFRQVQTALITYYIDQENNFSPFYNQPIFGKPWGVQMEFPLYQWSVVGLSRLTHWEHFIAARTISLASFYLTLAAIFVVLARMGFPWWRRLLLLSLLLGTPVYLFYSRAFLIDPMALMFSAWFLALFVETMERRHWALLLLCTFCGTAAGLIKSLVFFAWVVPAACFGAWKLWEAAARRHGAAEISRVLGWGLGAMVLPMAALAWWVPVTDAIKDQHPNAYFLTSHNLSYGNYGTFTLGSRLSPATWHDLFARWSESVAAPWAVGALVLAGVIVGRKSRWWILALAGLFILPQLAIPYAYSGQDYYFYTCVAFLVLGFGFAANAVMDRGWPWLLRWALVLVPFVPMADAYRRNYYQWQSVQSSGGSQLAFALRDVLPPQSVIMVAGMDWAAMLPYYSQHKALMLRRGMASNPQFLNETFAQLKDEDVAALILVGEERTNRALVQRAAEHFGLDPVVAFSSDEADVYISRFYLYHIMAHRITADNNYRLKVGKAPEIRKEFERVDLPEATMRSAFAMVHPVPSGFASKFGYEIWPNSDGVLLNAHPDLDLWVPVKSGAATIEWEFGILQDAWDRAAGEGTIGVEFIVDIEDAQKQIRPLFTRVLRPKTVERDRGLQKEKISFMAKAGEHLIFRTRPVQGSYAFDWAYWRRINVH